MQCMVCYGMLRYAVVCYGMLWHAVVWYGELRNSTNVMLLCIMAWQRNAMNMVQDCTR